MPLFSLQNDFVAIDKTSLEDITTPETMFWSLIKALNTEGLAQVTEIEQANINNQVLVDTLEIFYLLSALDYTLDLNKVY